MLFHHRQITSCFGDSKLKSCKIISLFKVTELCLFVHKWGVEHKGKPKTKPTAEKLNQLLIHQGESLVPQLYITLPAIHIFLNHTDQVFEVNCFLHKRKAEELFALVLRQTAKASC